VVLDRVEMYKVHVSFGTKTSCMGMVLVDVVAVLEAAIETGCETTGKLKLSLGT